MPDYDVAKKALVKEKEVPVEILPNGEIVDSSKELPPVKPTMLGEDREGEYIILSVIE